MNDKEKVFLQQFEEIFKNYEYYQKNRKLIMNSGNGQEIINSLITRMKSIVERITGDDSEYYKRIEEIFVKYEKQYDHLKLEPLKGVLDGLYQDLKMGYLKSFSELIHSDIFSDYIEMAEYLLEEGYKDPAAVITGSTLEEHLRKLCIKNGIDIKIMLKEKLKPKKTDSLNSELARQKVYSKLEQKSVTAWLDLRNKAAHGNYSEYNDDQVKLMIMGVRDFIVRNLA
ncbi:hypothetical protein LCGC14_1434760 [marine sediment metagenome]|uniref:DUF4145 domain-containing protein n=1 Tax=marine sediment metagenome TaxID=412755 RepID=A0A0F9JMG3_9ZZZZ